MKKIVCLSFICLTMSLFGFGRDSNFNKPYEPNRDLLHDLPVLSRADSTLGFKFHEGTLQVPSTWTNAIGIVRGISLEQAIEIANEYPQITFFSRARSKIIVHSGLTPEGYGYSVLEAGDTLFFSGEPQWLYDENSVSYQKYYQ